MQRIASVMLATAVAGVSCLISAQAQAAETLYMGNLDFGDHSIVITPVTWGPSSNGFRSEVEFSLANDSHLTGLLTGVRKGAGTLYERWFNELSGQMESHALNSVTILSDRPFDLGVLSESLVQTSAHTYVISLTNFLSDAGLSTGAGFTLSVQPAVPEPGTWALMGLGLVGVAAVSRRRARA